MCYIRIMMKTWQYLILIFLGILIIIISLNHLKNEEVLPLEQEEPSLRTVLLYYYNPSLDQDETGNLKCSLDGLVSLERKIPITISPIQDTLQLLLEGNLSEEEINSGVTTEFPLEGFTLKGASLKEGVLSLEFNDPNNQTIGGSCRTAILWSQIKETAKQFEEVISVKFLPEDLFQP